MVSSNQAVQPSNATAYLGQTVLLELVCEEEPESHWCCAHIVGVVLPMKGVMQEGYFLAIEVASGRPYPDETFFTDIRTIRVMRHRDRHGSGNVLGQIAHPNLGGSGAALPARRNGSAVPANGSTGAAHP